MHRSDEHVHHVLSCNIYIHKLGNPVRQFLEKFSKFQPVDLTKLQAWVACIDEGFIQKRRQRSSLLFGGQNLYSVPRRASCFSPDWYEEKDELHQDDIKKRMHESFSSNRPGQKWLAWQRIDSVLSPNDICLLFSIILLLYIISCFAAAALTRAGHLMGLPLPLAGEQPVAAGPLLLHPHHLHRGRCNQDNEH